MKPEITQFFIDNHIPMDKMIFVGTTRKALSSESIQEAAEQVYEEIQNGEFFDPLRLSWDIFSRAKRLKAKADGVGSNNIANLSSQLHKRKEEHKVTQSKLQDIKDINSKQENQIALKDAEIAQLKMEKDINCKLLHMENLLNTIICAQNIPWYKKLLGVRHG